MHALHWLAVAVWAAVALVLLGPPLLVLALWRRRASVLARLLVPPHVDATWYWQLTLLLQLLGVAVLGFVLFEGAPLRPLRRWLRGCWLQRQARRAALDAGVPP